MPYTGITGYTTSDLEKMQRTVIGQAKFTREHKGCMVGLSERFDLEQGQSTLTIPKLSAFDDAQDLQDGVDMTQAQQIANSYTDITTAEIGIKGIITDKLIRQMNESVWRMLGRLLGDSMKRKIEKDGLDLLDGFSNALGATNTPITSGYLAAAITQLLGQSEPAPDPFAYVGHPYQVKILMDTIAKVGTYPLPEGFSAQMVKDYWRGTFDMFGTPVFANGLIPVDSSGDAKGAVFSKSAIGYVVSKEAYTERQRDASLRAWELVHVQDSDWVELDDAYGREMYFDCATPTS
jgi:hypothetical protein